MKKLKIKIISEIFSPDELIPEYKTHGSAGMDLKAAIPEPIILKPKEIRLIPTGIAIGL